MKFINTIEIQANPDKVFYWLEDPDRAMQWMNSVTKYEIIKETPQKVGTTFSECVEEDGQGLELQGVVTEFVTNEKFAVRLDSDYNRVEVRFTLNKKGNATQLTQSVDMRFKGKLKLLSPFIASSIRKKILNQSQKEFARLKKLCEQQEKNPEVG